MALPSCARLGRDGENGRAFVGEEGGILYDCTARPNLNCAAKCRPN